MVARLRRIDNSLQKRGPNWCSSKKVIVTSSLVVFFLGLGLNHAYAAHVFESTTIYNDHPFRISIVSPTDPGAVTVSSTGVSCPYTLTQVPSTSIWQSSYVYFTASGDCSSTAYPIGGTLTGDITATYSGGTEIATVISQNDPGWPLAAMNPQPWWGKKVSNCSSPVNYGGDTDGDGICNNWEDGIQFEGLDIPCVEGSTYCAGPPTISNYQLACGPGDPDPVCPTTGMKDVYVEVDYMNGHRPSQTAIDNVVAAFSNAGIARLHVLVDDDVILHRHGITTPIAGGAGSTEFDTIKKAFYGTDTERALGYENTSTYNHKLTSKKQAFHYALFIHQRSDALDSSGTAEQPGNDFIISLGHPGFLGAVGSGDHQEGTFMHELGHNLKLDHGGTDAINCKPNYLSVMSFSRQFAESYTVNRDLDYSRQAMGPRTPGVTPDTTFTLTESSLDGLDNPGTTDPASGIDNYVTPEQIVYGVSTGSIFRTANVNSDVDWDGDNTIENAEPSNINVLSDRPGCTTSLATESLVGVKDWDTTAMLYNSKTYSSWNDGVQAKGSIYQNPEPYSPIYKDKTWIKDWIKAFWYKKYNNTGTNKNYYLPDEITGTMVRAMRSDNVLHLDFNIQNLSDGSFSNPPDQKAALHSELMKVNVVVNEDNLHEALFMLLKIRDDVQSFITMAHDRDNILSLLDNLVMQFEVATDTYQPIVQPPDKAIVSFDSPIYHGGNTATITIEAPFANLDEDKIETILARVASGSNEIGMLIELRETGPNTGIFEIDNLLLDSGPSDATRHMPKLRANSGDTIKAEYFGSVDTATIS